MAFLAVIILVVALMGYFSQKVSNFAVTFLVLAVLAATGLQDVKGILTGFSNQAIVTIAVMFILSQALLNTGALQPLTVKLASWSSGKPMRLLLVLAITVSIASAFMNNTPIVIMMVPVLMALSREFGVAPSKLFIPVSFFAILGGTCTLMGTSTNLLIDGLSRDAGGPAFSVFEFAPLGLVFLLVGTIYMITIGHRLLPERESLSSLLPVEKRSTYVSEVLITQNSRILGAKVKDAFPSLGSIRFLELVRGEEIFIGDEARLLELEDGDALILEGEPNKIASFLDQKHATLATVVEDDSRVEVHATASTVYEMVILPDSSFLGRRVRDLGLNRQFGIKVMAIQRNGRHHRMDLRMMRLKLGDTLLVQAEPESLDFLRESGDVLVIDEYRPGEHATRAKRATLTLLAVVVLAALGVVPLVVLALAGAALMVFMGCLRGEEAFRAIDANVILIMIGTIPLGQALVDTHLVAALVDGLVQVLGDRHPIYMLAAIYLLSNLLTAFLSNATVAVLMTPFAFALASTMSISAKPLLMAIAFGAGTCFVSPIGYQTNLIVMGPGGYVARDYVRVGLPLSLILWVIAIWLIPVFWPF